MIVTYTWFWGLAVGAGYFQKCFYLNLGPLQIEFSRHANG